MVMAMLRNESSQANGSKPPASHRALTWWFGLMALGGLGFGLYADKRPFGDDVLAHPFVLYFVVVGLALLALRFALAHPVPDVLPERVLLLGCFVGVAAFLSGNWVAIHLLGLR
jgi:hypothetical protein